MSHAMIRNAAVFAGLCAVVLYLLPARVLGAAESSVTECMDHAWADYNSCLMSTESAFRKRLCDVRFMLDTAICVDEQR